MKLLISLLVFILFLFISIFCISNIFLTIFYSVPRLIKEKRQGNIVKKVPIIKIIWAPILFSIILGSCIYLSIKFIPNHLTEVTIAIIFAILVHLLRIGKKNKDMEEDFRRYYNEYLNPDINNIKSDGFKVANKPAYYLSETELKPLIIRAFEKYTTDDLRSAVAIYDKILDLNPCLIDQLTMRAQCLERLNFNLDAIDDYESAISNDSTDGNLYGLLGLLYQKVGNFESAEKYLKLSIEKGWKMYEPNFNMLSLLNNADLKNALMEKCKKPENLMRRNKKDFEDDLSEIDRNVFNTNLIKSIEGVKYGLALDPKNKVLLELHDYFYSKLN